MILRKLLLILSILIVLICGPAWADQKFSPSDEVCAYVANAYNRGEQKKLSLPLAQPIDIRNDGKPEKIDLIAEGNHGGYSLAVGVNKDGDPIEAGDYDPNGLWKLDQIRIFNFEKRNYIVAEQDNGPIDVTDLGKGNICRFYWIWTSTLDEDNDPKLCQQAANNKAFPEIPIGDDMHGVIVSTIHEKAVRDGSDIDAGISQAEQRPEINDKRVQIPSLGSMSLYRAASMQLEGAQTKVLVGRLIAMLPGGTSNEMLTFLDKDEVSTSKQNMAFIEFQKKFLENDWGGRVFPVHIGNRNLIEADHQAHYAQVVPPRILLRLSQDGVEILCHTSEKLNYEPAPPYYNMVTPQGGELDTLSVGGQRDILEEEKMKAKELRLPSKGPQ